MVKPAPDVTIAMPHPMPHPAPTHASARSGRVGVGAGPGSNSCSADVAMDFHARAAGAARRAARCAVLKRQRRARAPHVGLALIRLGENEARVVC